MRDLYIEAINKFMESKKMKDYIDKAENRGDK